MGQPRNPTEPLVRRCFDLLVELRRHREAPRLLTKAIAFLQTLNQDSEPGDVPVLLTVRVVRARKT